LEEVAATDASTDCTDSVDVIALTRRVATTTHVASTSCEHINVIGDVASEPCAWPATLKSSEDLLAEKKFVN